MTKIIIDSDKRVLDIPDRLPVLPLRDIVAFPRMVIPLVVGRDSTMAAVDKGTNSKHLILLVTQKDAGVDEPTPKDMYRIGVLGRIVQIMKLPNGLAKVLVEGVARVKVSRYYRRGGFLNAKFQAIEDNHEKSVRMEAAFRHLNQLFKDFILLNKQIPDEIMMTIDQMEDARNLADFVTIHLGQDMVNKQKSLEETDIYKLFVLLSTQLQNEIEILNIEQSIDGQVKDKITKSQRAYYLHEQLRTIKKELGEDPDDDISDVLEYQRKIKKARMTASARKKADEELKRLENTPMMSPEATVIRTYLDWLLDVPWYKKTKDNVDIIAASDILNEDHYGLEKPKDRILDHLAVLTIAKKIRGPIICLIGPPGVGKTSLGKSVARAIGRNFVRFSLGGVRDEAEIRGHRKTYIGALPGRIIQSMKKAGTVNPVFLLDEIDKMSTDFRGDPSSALLEVLDPEQNVAFSDHYLEVDYDLSQILFITTANTREDIPWALRDRMEMIELPSYLHQEKFEIARRFLVPKQTELNGLKPDQIKISDATINFVIERYTREAGVRELERMIAKLMRKAVRKILKADRSSILKIDVKQVKKMLGVPKYEGLSSKHEDRIGAVTGLAWTQAGGDLLIIETDKMTGKGTLTLTGNLGDVMQESARAALTAVRSRAEKIGFDGEDFLKSEVHVHFPEAAVSKDGPSAGITTAISIASAFSKRPVRGEIAITGELTLRGEILAIGGLREKLMAAVRGGIKRVVIPEKNLRDLSEVPDDVTRLLEITTVKNIDEVLEIMLLPIAAKESTNKRRTSRKGTQKSRTSTISS